MTAPDRGFLVGLLGSGIGPSLSPALHEREADRLGMRYLYRRLDIDELGVPADQAGNVLDAARLAGYDGLNITHPCKQLVPEHLDELSADAAALGAVNTVVLRSGLASGYNTDLSGFAGALRAGLPEVDNARVLLIGSGGAGSAIAHALLATGTGVLEVFDRDTDRAGKLVESLAARWGGDRAVRASSPEASLPRVRGLVHATPVGMAAHPGIPIDAAVLRPDLWVADAVYRPLQTELVRTARAAGCRVLDGGRMAVFQAVDSFRLFTGVEPDTDRMLQHFAELTGVESADSPAVAEVG